MPNEMTPAELRALHAAAKLGGPMVSVHIVSPGYEHCANLCTRLEGHKSDYPVAMMQAEWADCIAAIYNAFPSILDRLERAERERDAHGICEGADDMAKLVGGLRAELAAAKEQVVSALADALECAAECEQLESRAEAAEAEATVIAADWEKDCAAALRAVAESLGFEWDADGNPADQLQEHITETVRDLRDRLERAELERDEAVNKLAHLAASIEHYQGLEDAARDARQKALGAAEWINAYIVSGYAPESQMDRLREEAALLAVGACKEEDFNG